MIAYLKGKLVSLEPNQAIVECVGVGYLARISLASYAKLEGKKEVKLHTYLHVWQDGQVLYGFYDTRERGLFEQLITISGVGANTAIMILSGISPEELFEAIRMGDTQSLRKIKGIGAKTAGRIILELKDKIVLEGGEVLADGSTTAGSQTRQTKQEAVAALVSLGFSKSVVEKKVYTLLQAKADMSVEEIIKACLRS